MRLKIYVLDFHSPAWVKSALLFGCVPAALLTGAFALTSTSAEAKLGDGSSFGAGDTAWIASGSALSATKLKGNLADLQAQIDKPIITKNGKQYSLGASYCGSTAATNGQITGGYAGAKTLCESVVACSNSKSAHMCTADELVRSRQLQVNVPGGWYATGAYAYYAPSNTAMDDCNGFTSNSATVDAPAWSATATPTLYSCSDVRPVLCCD